MVAMYKLTRVGVDLINASTSIYSCQKKTKHMNRESIVYYLFDITI